MLTSYCARSRWFLCACSVWDKSATNMQCGLCLQSPHTDMISVVNFAVLLLVARLARGQLDCAYPTRTDLASDTLRIRDATTKAKSTGDSSK